MKFLLILMTLFIQPDELSGYWISSGSDLIVETYKKNDLYYSKIVWFKNTNPLVKKYSENGINKDKWIGYVVMSDMKKVDDHWEGNIFDIKNGKHYSSTLHKNGDIIKLRGYVLIPLLGEDVTFKKYINKLPKQN